ncbi:GNAT family N-acetyltransferase [Roseomonas stagni]|uniref:GNAT family N-acetyltransferase n=1 Tax=Falsiroseomonas algicola TaxID=2716930 RepID=A0A6M1LVZ6_9PROT|nr:GNAT family N-acetyltransferase [Falsiroseomonas algicola]NGM23654.1 GNAT family N-acetyltransferase [Falsiroseomonas algicola]
MNRDALPPIRRLDATEAAALAPVLAEVLVDCVAGGASVSFMHPLDPGRALAFWQGVAKGVAAGDRALFVAEEGGAVLGTVQLLLGMPENQPHRGEIAKMLVRRAARGRGLGTALMRAAEALARQEGRTLLVLDTAEGGDGERLYRRLGWIPVGTIPRFALHPDGRPCGSIFFYRDLAA